MVYIPNAFTPNNDGINDGFQVVISDVVYYRDQHLQPLGRRGLLQQDPDEVWMGNVKGGEHYVLPRLLQLPLALEGVAHRCGRAFRHH